MANREENFLLVEMTDDPHPPATHVVRSYLSRTRADEDLDLLQQVCPARAFAIISVGHIDD